MTVSADRPIVMRLEEDQVPTVALPEYCADARAFSVPGLDAALFVGLAKTGRFHLATSGETRLLAPNASSFAIAAGFLVYTTHAHLAHFAPLTDLPGVLGAQTSLPEWETRRVERGARLVAAVPSTSTLVLQMPRGNLENIAPRPLVLAVVRQDISAYVLSPLCLARPCRGPDAYAAEHGRRHLWPVEGIAWTCRCSWEKARVTRTSLSRQSPRL
jgi:hypothetical protein